MKYLLESVKAEIIPSKESLETINEICRKVIGRVNQHAKKSGIAAELIVGGSVAKNTWLPGTHDIDFFLQFDYRKFHDKSPELSNYMEKILKATFEDVKRLHGSRDYFQVKLDGFQLELVPVLKIANAREMVNITDVSPLHVSWVAKKTGKNKHLANEIRAAKKFFKAAKIYGAESFLNGFSGHVIEVLVSHYGSFEALLQAVRKWENGQIIDPEKHYKSEGELMEKMNESKLHSPLILVDPVQPQRNAAASLSKHNFDVLIKKAHEFARKPSLRFFMEEEVTLEELIKKRKDKKLIALLVKPDYEKIDVAGAKIMRLFKQLLWAMDKHDFKIFESGFEWDQKSEMLLWLFTNREALPELKKLHGPRKIDRKEFISSFREKYGKRVKADEKRFYAELPRKYRLAEQLLKDVLKDKRFQEFKILEVR